MPLFVILNISQPFELSPVAQQLCRKQPKARTHKRRQPTNGHQKHELDSILLLSLREASLFIDTACPQSCTNQVQCMEILFMGFMHSMEWSLCDTYIKCDVPIRTHHSLRSSSVVLVCQESRDCGYVYEDHEPLLTFNQIECSWILPVFDKQGVVRSWPILQAQS